MIINLLSTMGLIIILFFSGVQLSFSQISFDRTRIIFNQEANQSETITIGNTNESEPYLAQVWIEDKEGHKLMSPLAALPMLQRLNPKQKNQIRISLMGNTNLLPNNEESLLFFNLLGVPPKAEALSNGQMSVIIQTRLKLFYRPKGLKKYENSDWIKEVEVQKTSKGLKFSNPTPYHIVIYGISPNSSEEQIMEKDTIISPFQDSTININLPTETFSVIYVDDFGAEKKLTYRCSSNAPCQTISAH